MKIADCLSSPREWGVGTAFPAPDPSLELPPVGASPGTEAWGVSAARDALGLLSPLAQAPVPALGQTPGTCPRPRPGDNGLCASTCKSDIDCHSWRKCCRTGCGGTACMDTVKVG
uniref:WAP domain-containing protein n=1 Tax=Sphenodon punctatus TaxID=8508 RepID=A0A8D0GZB0_SPHPU